MTDDVSSLCDMAVEQLQEKLKQICNNIVELREKTDGEYGDDSRCTLQALHSCALKTVFFFSTRSPINPDCRPLATWSDTAAAADMPRPTKVKVRQQLQGHYGKVYALHWSQQVSIFDKDGIPGSIVRCVAKPHDCAGFCEC